MTAGRGDRGSQFTAFLVNFGRVEIMLGWWMDGG